MDDLVTFLTAQLDEDERQADALQGASWWIDTDEERIGDAVRHFTDDDRVLAEVAAKRSLMAGHEPVENWGYQKFQCRECASKCHSRSGLSCDQPDAPWPCEILRALAQPYASRPGWRPEWATEATA